ncbi:MAG: hypothetical protein L6V93_23155 [Clostridiales bacterium]|nr:MAG: hypothetical protein L6V93_23155 [Clostridiales bacterium]
MTALTNTTKGFADTFTSDQNFTLDIANAIFLSTDRAEGEFKEDYTNTLKNFYGAEPMKVTDKKRGFVGERLG